MMPAAAGRDRRSRILLASGFALVTAMFAAVVVRFPDNFFADDSYFYFQVAWNIARGMGSTFNGIIPTNGYHPLWMLVCVAVFKALHTKSAAVHGIGGVIALLDGGALLLLSRLLARVAPGAWWVPFALYMPFCFLSQLGTEGALSGFFLAALAFAAYLLHRSPSGRNGFLFALCGSLSVLSRLDNIFIVSLVFLAAFLVRPDPAGNRIRRILIFCIPIYLVLWGTYIASNVYWFGTVQPISGMLKAHPHGDFFIATPPHIALLSLGIAIPCVSILARFRRDTFFRAVELPFTGGVLLHASYITLVMRMGNETRWSWYYTSWILLSAIVLSRVVSVALAARPALPGNSLAWAALAGLLVAWFPLSERRFDHPIPGSRGDGYQQEMSGRLHLHTVIAFDKPGRMAFFSDVRVIALDGLMGDLKFQRDLASEGIAAFDAEHGVEAFVGPPMPLNPFTKALYCDHVALSATHFHCVPAGTGAWMVDDVEVFSRLTAVSAGHIALRPENLLWNRSYDVSVWRLP